MRIEVSTPELHFPIKLIFPTAALRSRWLWRIALKYTESRQKDTVMYYRDLITESVSHLEEFVRNYGHFNLVEIEERDGTRVIIRI